MNNKDAMSKMIIYMSKKKLLCTGIVDYLRVNKSEKKAKPFQAMPIPNQLIHKGSLVKCNLSDDCSLQRSLSDLTKTVTLRQEMEISRAWLIN